VSLLRLDDVVVSVPAGRGRVRVVDGVGFALAPGETLGVVGESGSGKSLTALSVMGLLPAQARLDAGRIALSGEELVGLPSPALRALRGRAMAMIFQEPMTSLNPLFRAGFQIGETLEAHLGLSRAEARKRAVALMRAVGFPAPESQVDSYPHELSGGMRQRVMIAMAIALEPRLLIADEPTTALDVTIQAQILTLLRRLRAERGMGLLLITHDLGVIAGMADRVVVMYAGQVVEEAATRALFAAPRHPYTRRLLQSVPRSGVKLARLNQIAGTAPQPTALPGGCRFHPRCPDAIALCRSDAPPIVRAEDGSRVRCWRADDPALAA
jgi:oligopeptide/dipeptide ABC transporter ATP-binding protein